MHQAAERRAPRSSARCGCRCAGRSAASAPSRARRRAARCSASCRAATTRRCASQSARALVDIGFHGYAIGGLAVGEPQEVMLEDRRGGDGRAAGRPAALSDGRRHAGRSARGGGARHRHVRLRDADPQRPPRRGVHAGSARSTSRNARHRDDPRPLDEQSAYPAARTYSRAYLHHLVRANEMLGAMLLSAINLAYYQELMAGMREAIARRTLCRFPRADARRLGEGRSAAGLAAIQRRHAPAAR